jgi:hypothetical protein
LEEQQALSGIAAGEHSDIYMRYVLALSAALLDRREGSALTFINHVL